VAECQTLEWEVTGQSLLHSSNARKKGIGMKQCKIQNKRGEKEKIIDRLHIKPFVGYLTFPGIDIRVQGITWLYALSHLHCMTTSQDFTMGNCNTCTCN
jgi:hypothetical protein